MRRRRDKRATVDERRLARLRGIIAQALARVRGEAQGQRATYCSADGEIADRCVKTMQEEGLL